MQIEELATSTRKLAEGTAIQRHKKEASFQLYRVLTPCLELVERCQKDPLELARLEQLFKSQHHTGNRRFVERSSDIFVHILVCRYVFETSNRSNAIRYAQALAEAQKLQLTSKTLGEHLKHKGGVASLYYKRPLLIRKTQAKVLRLDRPVTYSRDEPLVLTLQWQDDNTFKVIDARPQ